MQSKKIQIRNIMRKKTRVSVRLSGALVFTLGFCLIGSSFSYGQTTGTIAGTVRDESGAVLPGVGVIVQNTENGRIQEGVSDDQGRYRVAGLPAGSYQVTASLPGFRKATRPGIKLEVAQELALDLKLQVGEISEEVTVTGEAPIVDTTVSSVSGVINNTQMTELPLNGRDFTKLSLLETGTVSARNTDQTFSKGFGTRVAVSGSRPDQTGYLLDGTDINSWSNFQVPGSVTGVILGVEAVREFRVEVSNFSAEFGRSAGGVFNMISKSGTNEIHGSAFEFHRNDNLDARNFFAIPRKPEFRRHQFGVSLGGPIVRNQTFFFADYEGLREAKGLSQVGFVPDENARRGFLPAPGGTLREVGVANNVRTVLQELYPLPNGPIVGGGIATFNNPGQRVANENYWVIKLDHQFSERNHFFVRYNFDDGEVTNPFVLPNFTDFQQSRYQYVTLEESQTFSPILLNVARFAFNRTLAFDDGAALHPISITFRPGQPLSMGGIGVGGLSGTGGRSPEGSIMNLAQYMDSIYYTRGAHSLKFGGSVSRIHLNDADHSRLGTFNFADLESFLRGIPQTLSEAEMPGSDGIRGWRQWLPGFYLQDDWRVSSRVTANLGLRWEFYTVPREVNGKVSNLRNVETDREMTVGDPFWKNPSLKNLSPRVGLAWDPWGNGKTVVRAGYGIFYHMMFPPYYKGPGGRNDPFFFYISVRNPAPDLFPDIVKTVEREASRGTVTREQKPIQFDLKNPYEQKFNFTVSHELFRDTALTLGYLGGRGVKLLYIQEANTARSVLVDGRWIIPPGSRMRNPAFGAMRQTRSGAHSFYNGLQVKLDRRFSAGFQARVSYTFSRTVDDATTSVGLSDLIPTGFPQNADNLAGDRGLSNIDVRHSFTSSWLYKLPMGSGLGRVGKALLADWNLNGILSLAAGTPFNVSLNYDNAGTLGRFLTLNRPDLAPGANNNPVNRDNPNQYFDVTAFIPPPPNTFGNLGRDTVIGPGYANLDFGLTKENMVPGISEGFKVQVRLEVFNVLNRAQFATPASNVFSNRTTRIPTAGRIARTSSDNRQIQLGLKFVW
ncbi:MAG: TonB-dependent receptor [Acidobacteria bacterium]|nr:TonB-dependent receptor [Acidobacteriota bacterium]